MSRNKKNKKDNTVANHATTNAVKLKTTVPEVKLLDGGEFHELHLSAEFINMYEHLCKVINTMEWCGMVFYTTEVIDDNTGEFKYKPIYLHPMDKGSSTFTSHTFDKSYTDLLLKKPELMEDGVLWGTIH